MPAEVRPYLVPSEGTIVWEPWAVLDGERWSALGEALDGWDPSTDLHVMRRLRVDPIAFRHESGLELTDAAVTVSWTSSTTDMTEATAPQLIGADGSVIIDAILVGERLSGVLTLRTTISLIRRGASTAVGTASIPGSVLAEDSHRVTLEGLSSLFPIHEIDFASTRLSPAASWHLETGTDLSMPFYGTFRILINKQDKELSGAVARGQKDKRQLALLDELEAGVSGLLLELALNLRTELDEQDEWPTDSVGDVLSRLLDMSDISLKLPASAHDSAETRTRIAGAVRVAGKGRVFQ